MGSAAAIQREPLVVVDVELDVLDLLMPMAANKWGVHGAAGVKDAQAAGVTAANPAGPSMAEVIGARQSAEAKAHMGARARAAELSRLSVPVLRLDRARLEAGDERKAGSEDGVHGIYLGELVWALIGEVVRKITKKQPSKLLYNATTRPSRTSRTWARARSRACSRSRSTRRRTSTTRRARPT